MSESDEEVEVTLIKIPVEQIADLRLTDSDVVQGGAGTPLTDLFPDGIYATMRGGEVIEVGPNLSVRMRAMGFTDD